MTRSTHRSTQAHPTWLVLIYQTATHGTQQEILRKFAELGQADIIVLGTSRDQDTFVIAECPGLGEKAVIERIVTSIDDSAQLVHSVKDPRASLASFMRGDKLG